jgi:hypothetical protein
LPSEAHPLRPCKHSLDGANCHICLINIAAEAEQQRCAVCSRPKGEHGKYRGYCLPGFGDYPRNSKFTPEEPS